MLRSVEDGPAIVACNTCRYSREAREDLEGSRGGVRLVEALREVQAADERYAGIAVQEMPCLFACSEHCVVHVRAPGKVAYVLGRFVPGTDAAAAIFELAVRYADSEHGRVPFAQWPQGVKGHFITRTPPPGFVVE